jgi:predicted ATPase/DNA-binding CsgD family transcriptional regulator
MLGPGGVGKTRLAVSVAATTERALADGAWFVSLAPVRSPEWVVPTIARTLGLKDDGDRPLEERLRQHIGHRRVLLVLDNVEHVVTAAPLITELLVACPRLQVLATSRVALRLTGEHEYHVPPLPVPDPTWDPSAPELAANEAVVLFLQRARAVRPEFALTEAHAATIAEIVRRLDGLPLAIELAAARVRVLSPQALLARLSHRLQVLVDGPRDLPARLQTMRDAIAWSHDLLTLEEQALFRRLAVFVGGFPLEAAEAVSRGQEVEGRENDPHILDPRPSTLDLVASLVDKSLLHRVDQDDGDARFGMLETIREFGLHELERHGEVEIARRLHADYFLALGERASQELLGQTQRDWLDRLELEHDNLRAALGWLASSEDAKNFGRLAVWLNRFWWIHGHLSEGRDWAERAAEAACAADLTGLRADLLYGAGFLAHYQSDGDAARAHTEASLALKRDLGDPAGQAMALGLLGTVALQATEYVRARSLMEEALAFYRATGDADGVAGMLNNLAIATMEGGAFAEAAALFAEARSTFAGMDNEQGVAAATSCLGYAMYWQGEFAQAAALAQQACEISRGLGEKFGMAIALLLAGKCARRRGHFARSWTIHRESLALWRAIGNTAGLADWLAAAAALMAAAGRAEPAVRALGAESAWREAARCPEDVNPRAETERVAAGLRAALGPDRFAATWAAGGSLGLEQAIAAAEAELSDWARGVAAGQPGAVATPFSLTPRELEVLRLLAAGRSDREIAGELFISHRTVHRHVAGVYAKLGVSSRAAAGRLAHGAGLLGDDPPLLT